MSRIVTNIAGWSDLPEHVRLTFESAFNKNPKVVKLLKQAQDAYLNKDFATAVNCYHVLDEARLKAQLSLMQEKEREVEEVSLVEMNLSQQDLDKVNILTIAMYMACDMIEFFVTDVNEILSKQDPTARLEMFEPIRNAGKAARENLYYLGKNTKMYETEFFNDSSDNMREMLINKAKKVYIQYAKQLSDGK